MDPLLHEEMRDLARPSFPTRLSQDLHQLFPMSQDLVMSKRNPLVWKLSDEVGILRKGPIILALEFPREESWSSHRSFHLV